MDDANAKVQSILGDDKDSRIEVLSDLDEATFRINFVDENKPSLEILMSDFIDEKSARAKGKRVTTLEVASIEDITPEPVVEESEPEVSPDESGEALEEEGLGEPVDKPESSDSEVPETIDVEGVTMTFEKPKDTQLDLF